MQVMGYKRSGMEAAQLLPVPVFSLWDFYMATGIVGGYMTSGSVHGERAARLAERVINGEDADTMPVVTRGINVPVFDLAAIRPYGVSRRDLPPDSIIHNAPQTLWQRYRIEILFTITAFLLLISLVLIS